MVEFTVSIASACIAAGIAALQFLLPNALALVLTGTLSDSHSAVTWSVVSRFLLSSDWPLFLNSETTASTSVAPRQVGFVTWLKPIGLFILAIAAVVTPLGLHDGVYPSDSTDNVSFVYVLDKSPFGAGTPARSSKLGFSRTCASTHCPGEPDLGNVTWITPINSTLNTTTTNYIRSPELPQSLVDLYQSGITDQDTVSSFFDVQFRQWRTMTLPNNIDNSSQISEDYKTLGNYILNNRYDIVEGAIIDTKNGTVGFRNHSIPTGLTYGAEWNEDILFLEPEAACVNLNISTFFVTDAIGNGYVLNYTNGLIDRGGFVNINRTNPYPGDEYPFMDGQRAPKLYERAYYAAWGVNVLSMQYLNISTPHTNLSQIRSTLGQRFLVNDSFLGATEDVTFIKKTSNLGSLVSPPDNYSLGTNFSWSSNPSIPNPYNITTDMFDDQSTYCQTSFGGDPVNITELAVKIGMFAGVGRRTDPGFEGSTDYRAENATWERPLYVCAGATRAIIKTVTFRYNTTLAGSLAGLSIVDIRNKYYDQSSQALPIWGYETPKMNISQINPLWGIIDPDRVHSATNLTTVQSPHFYIPASQDSSLDLGLDLSTTVADGENMPLIRAPPVLWSTTTFSSTSEHYSGSEDVELQRYWSDLSRNSTGIERIAKLIWTNYAGNFLVGTRGHQTPKFRQPSAPDQKRQAGTDVDLFPVHVLTHHIRYHWIYGIPAIICISIVGLACLLAFISMVCGQGTISRLRYYLFHITSGRVLAAHVYPDNGVELRNSDTKTWIKEVGNKPIMIFKQGMIKMDTIQTTSTEQYPSDFNEVKFRSGQVPRGKAEYVKIHTGDESDVI